MRINQFLAHFSGLSRRKADKAIKDGRVTVNGGGAQIGQEIATNDSVKLDEKKIETGQYQYVIFHKPIGYITSRAQQGSDPTIYELLPEEYHNLKPVGRLDKDTSGLLLLTNDGDYSNKLAHPSGQKQKTYRLELDKLVDSSNLALIQGPGVELQDGSSRMSVKSLSETKPRYEIIISEGRNRQIRRSFEHLGYEIVKLHRTQFGPYTLEGIEPGSFVATDMMDII